MGAETAVEVRWAHVGVRHDTVRARESEKPDGLLGEFVAIGALVDKSTAVAALLLLVLLLCEAFASGHDEVGIGSMTPRLRSRLACIGHVS